MEAPQLEMLQAVQAAPQLVAQAVQAAQAAQVLVPVAQQQAASAVLVEYRQQQAVLVDPDRIAVLVAPLQSILVLPVWLLVGRRQVLLVELAALVQRLAVRHQVALVEPAATLTAAQAARAVSQDPLAVLAVQAGRDLRYGVLEVEGG
jgi:hypothetical protein